jgi:hypothetical protein
MPRLLSEPVERTHILLYAEDLRKLKLYYSGGKGVGPAVRDIVRLFLKRLDERIEKKLAQDQAQEELEPTDVRS